MDTSQLTSPTLSQEFNRFLTNSTFSFYFDVKILNLFSTHSETAVMYINIFVINEILLVQLNDWSWGWKVLPFQLAKLSLTYYNTFYVNYFR